MSDKTYASSIELSQKVATKIGSNKQDTHAIVKAVRESIMELVAEKGELRIDGLGSFRVSHRAARVGMNPRNRAKVNIPAMNVVTFRTGKKLREAVAGK